MPDATRVGTRIESWVAPGLAVALLLPTLCYPLARDQGVFAYAGDAIVRGAVPYRDFWDIKPPAIYLTYALIRLVMGPSALAIHLVDVLAAAGMSAALFSLARREFGPGAGLAAAGWYAALYLRGGYWSLAQAESFANLFLAMAAVMVQQAGGRDAWVRDDRRAGSSAARRAETAPRKRVTPLILRAWGRGGTAPWLAAGAATGMAVAYKFTSILPGAVILLWGVFERWQSMGQREGGSQEETAGRSGAPGDGGRRALKTAAAMALGVLLPLGLTIAWLAAAGCLRDYLEIQNGFVRPYAALAPAGPHLGAWASTLGFSRGRIVPLVLAGLGLIAAMTGRSRRLPRLGLAWAAAAYLGILLQNKYFGYHWTPLIAPLALLAGVGWNFCAGLAGQLAASGRGAGGMSPWWPGIAGAALVVAWSLAGRWPSYRDTALLLSGRLDRDRYDARFGEPPGRGDFSPLADRWAARYVRSHTRPGDPVYIWGFEPLVYVLSDRRPPTRFIFNVPQIFPGAPLPWRQELVRDLQRREPALFIVMRHDAIPWASGTDRDSATELARYPELQEFLRQRYQLETTLEDFSIYRLRRRSGPTSRVKLVPELPEVELAARFLRDSLIGRRIIALEVVDEKLLAAGTRSGWSTALANRAVEAVERRAKYLLLHLPEALTVVAHLRMTGRFVFEAGEVRPLAHPARLALELEGGGRAIFRDPRRFARFWLSRAEELDSLPELVRLGPDALLDPPSAEQFQELVRGRRQSIKALLMDQRRIGGLGNICATEILYRANIPPWRPAGGLGEEECARLAQIIPGYLRWAIERQARRDLIYLGERGAENVFSIYRRSGEACPRCGAGIRRTVVAGRGTYFCPECQAEA